MLIGMDYKSKKLALRPSSKVNYEGYVIGTVRQYLTILISVPVSKLAK